MNHDLKELHLWASKLFQVPTKLGAGRGKLLNTTFLQDIESHFKDERIEAPRSHFIILPPGIGAAGIEFSLTKFSLPRPSLVPTSCAPLWVIPDARIKHLAGTQNQPCEALTLSPSLGWG